MPVSVGKVRYRLNKSLLIKNLLIKDTLNDTAIYIERIDASLNSLNVNSKSLDVNVLKIKGWSSNIYYIDSNQLNITSLINKLKSDKKQTFQWNIKCKKLDISDTESKFRYINGELMAFNESSLKLTDIFIDSTTLNLAVKQVKLKHNQEEIINDFSFYFRSDFKNHNVKSLNLTANNSRIKINEVNTYIDSTHQLKGNINISSSTIYLSDFGTIFPDLKMYNDKLILSGNFEFDPKLITGNDFKFFIGDYSSINANFRILNYKHKDKLAYFINLENCFSNYSDINKITKNFFHHDTTKIPQELYILGEFSYQGIIKGQVDSIVSQGKLYSELGIIQSDLYVKNDNKQYFVEGNLKTLPIHLNLVTKNEKFGDLKLDINTSGSYSKGNGIDMDLDGYISNINYGSYNIDSIAIDGHLDKSQFKGSVSSFDPNLRADFDGSITYGAIPKYNFESNIYYANLHALGINKKDTLSNISVNLNAQFEGDSFDNSNGEITISDLFYFQDTSYFGTDSIVIKSILLENNKKHLSLESEYIDINLSGEYKLQQLIKDARLLASTLVPTYITSKDSLGSSRNNFTFEINAKYPHPLIEIIDPEIRISPGTTVSGKYNSSKQDISLLCTSSQIIAYGKKLSDLKLRSYTKNGQLHIYINSNELKYSDNNSLKNFLLSFSIYNDTIKSNLNWNNWLDKNYSGNINSTAIILPSKDIKKPNIKINFSPSNIIVVDTLWTLNACSVIKDSSGITFDGMDIEKGKSQLLIHGKLSKNPNDSILFEFNNLSLHNLNILLKKDQIKFGGQLDGTTMIKDFYGDRKIESDFVIKQFKLNNEIVGKTFGKSSWNKEKKQIDIEGNIYRNKKQTLSFDGFVATARNDMLINMSFDKQNMQLLEAFLKPTFDHIKGELTGNVRIFGAPKFPDWEGNLYANNASLDVVPTKVKYHFSDSLIFRANQILFNKIKIYDADSNIAILNGNIHHQELRNFGVNLKITTNRILGLDRKHFDSPYYYGKMYGAGVVNINGPTNDIDIDVAATTLEESRFYIPLESKGDIAENDFITFIDHSIKEEIKQHQENDKPNEIGIKARTEIRVDITVTPVTDIQIIFDPIIGDVLKANGDARINMQYTPEDGFEIYGDFIIEKGDYIFTLQDVIKKKLEIVQGSSVRWTGDAGKADVAIDAIYRVHKTSLKDLTQVEADADKRVPVNCHMLMTNKLDNPEINFEIEVTSTTNNEAVEQLNSLPEAELNKQIVSLLLLNKFLPLIAESSEDAGISSSSLQSTTVSDLLSNQLSYWLSQINSDIDLGFTYRTKTENTAAEYELALSTTLFNDRVTLYGNVGVGGEEINADNPNAQYTTDFSIEYKVTKKGNVRIKAFQKENDDILDINQSRYKHGVGIFYTEEFNTVKELYQKIFKKGEAKKPDEIMIQDIE